MSFTRRIMRSTLLIVTLAYALALGQVVHARMIGAHGPAGHAAAAMEVLCAEHGTALPGGHGSGDQQTHPCLDCTLCAVKVFASAGPPDAVPTDWRLRTAGAVVYPAGFDPERRSRPPPPVKARGPPILI